MGTKKPYQLDRSIPFVKAVFDRVENKAPLEPVVEILRDAEHRHGARWIYQWHGRGPYSFFKPLDGKMEFSADRLKRALLSEILASDYAVALPETASAKPDNGIFVPLVAGELEADELRLHGLLSECGLVFDGCSLIQELFVAYDDGAVQGWTNRGWGHFMAKWANAHKWQGKQDWEYSFFAFNAYCMIDGYDGWSRVLLEAIKKNSEYLSGIRGDA